MMIAMVTKMQERRMHTESAAAVAPRSRLTTTKDPGSILDEGRSVNTGLRERTIYDVCCYEW